MHFLTPWVAVFCYLFLVEKQKVGHLERWYIGRHFPHSFVLWFGFAGGDCHIQFSLSFLIAVGLAVLSVFGHNNSCFLGLGDAVAD